MLSSPSTVTPIDTPKYVTSAPPSPNSSLASTPTNATFARAGANPVTSRVPTKYGTPPHEPAGSPLTGSYPPSASNSAAPSPLLGAFSSSLSGNNPRHKRHRRDSSAPLIGTPPIFNTEAIETGELVPHGGMLIYSGSESGASYGRVSLSTPRPLSPGAAALGPLSPTFTRGNLLSDKFHISNEEDYSGSEDADSVSDAALSDTENDSKHSRMKLLVGTAGNGSADTNAFGNADGSSARIRDVRLDGFPEDEIYIGLSHQTIHLPEEDLKIHLTGYQLRRVRVYAYHIIAICSLGAVYLLARWLPRWWVRWVGVECPLGEARFMVVENQWGETTIERITHRYYGGAIGTVFSTEQVGEELLKLGPEPMASRLLGERRYLNPSEPLNYLHLLDYRYLRMAYHPGLRQFLQTGYWKDPAWTSTKTLRNGLTREQHRERKSVFDENLIDVKEKPIVKLLIDEVLNPFYIFQVFSIMLWCFDDYYYYAFCIFIISATSIITTLIETKQTMKRMAEMSKFECVVRVCRNGFWRDIPSSDLVPGDILEVSAPNLHTLPCDAVLLTGDCILNESMLTGESIPVSKLPVTDIALRCMDLSAANIPADVAKHFLFSGTKIVRVRTQGGGIKGARLEELGNGEAEAEDSMAIAMVVRTGFNTAKGALVRSMLFPKPNKFQFYRDSFRFIGVLAIIAVLGFLVSAINFIRMGVPLLKLIIRALDLVTIVVPPALPATMSIGTSFAIARLRHRGIFCISPPRVNIGGKIDCMSFDKTGTLTEDGLDVLGVRCVDRATSRFSEEMKEVAKLENRNDAEQQWDAEDGEQRDTSSLILHAMTTCHALRLVEGGLIGDPLDLKMFEFTRWELEESGGGTSTIAAANVTAGTSRRRDLESGFGNGVAGLGLNGVALGAGSKGGIVPTVVRPPGGKRFDIKWIGSTAGDGKSPPPPLELGIIRCFEFVSSLRRMSVVVRRLSRPALEVYVKGAPEVTSEICLKETMPVDYQEQLQHYTHRGYRVIACASKSLGNMKWHKLQKLKRHEVETGLTFLGFVIFENKLKPGTAPVIATLKEANIRQVMCTGDNVLTAISVSRECGLVDPAAEIFAPRFIQGSSTTPDSTIVWESVLQEGRALDPDTLRPDTGTSFRHNHTAASPFFTPVFRYELAITGDVFRWMVDYSPPDNLLRMLVKGQIFARMSPDEKQELVEKLQTLGYCVGFCGDGANDCGALKAADVGISLSEAEASVAAPFTSKTMDIGCVVDVIREGRAALVTSFSCFKYMALYSIIQFTTVTLLYVFDSNLGDFQFLYIDLFLILPIAVFMGRTEAYPYLHPKRPTASLMSKKVLTSLIGQILICSGFQGLIYKLVQTQPWYETFESDPAEKNIQCYEDTVLFMLSCFQYILIAVVFSVGPPYRKAMWTNVPFVVSTIFLVLLTIWIITYPPESLVNLLDLLPIPAYFRGIIIALAVANFVLSWVAEKYGFPVVAGWVGRMIESGWRDVLRGREGYSSVEGRGKRPKKEWKRIAEELGIR